MIVCKAFRVVDSFSAYLFRFFPTHGLYFPVRISGVYWTLFLFLLFCSVIFVFNVLINKLLCMTLVLLYASTLIFAFMYKS